MDTNVAAAGPDAGETVSTASYRPHLDGLRAVAVYLVLVFHAGIGAFSGGFIGVDVFFVLSGFLVTQLLLRDVARSGSIRFGRFYARRFRRLLPAAFVTLIVTALVYSAIASPVEVADAVGSFKAAFLYSTNWYFIHEATGYFGADLAANPVLHFWSLAVEEQFYLLWPLALAGLFGLTRRFDEQRRIKVLRIVIAVAAVASALWALSLRNTDPNRAYYGTDTRAYELLAGAFIALVPAFVASAGRLRRTMRIGTVASVAALLIVASSWIDFDAIERGIAVTIITCALLVAIEAADGGLVKWVLSSPPVVYLGKISYGTYLWHWIVILVVLRTFDPAPIPTMAIAALVATSLAALSYQILEHPVRISPLLDRHRRTVVAGGLALSIVSALVFIPAIVDPADAEPPALRSNATVGFTPVPANLTVRDADKGRGVFQHCHGAPVDACTIVRGSGPSILLIGDSHAQMFVPTFAEIARRENLTLSVSAKGFCPWQRRLYPTEAAVKGLTNRALTDISIESCTAQKEDLYTRVIPELNPDVIVAVNLGAYNQNWPATTAQTAAEIRNRGAQLVIIEPIPKTFVDPLNCLSAAKVLEECRFVASAKADPIAVFGRQLANQREGVYSADFDQLVCPFYPICDPVVNGAVVRWDSSHLTLPFATSLAPDVAEYLKQLGIIPT